MVATNNRTEGRRVTVRSRHTITESIKNIKSIITSLMLMNYLEFEGNVDGLLDTIGECAKKEGGNYGWVDPKERMPPRYDNCLRLYKNSNNCYFTRQGHWDGENWHRSGREDFKLDQCEIDNGPDFWAPIPKFPE